MKILDLFCGQGIATRGLIKHGDVTGIDNNAECEKHYPGKFILSSWKDALEAKNLDKFDFIWASPPCQAYTVATLQYRQKGHKYIDILREVIEEVEKTGKPFCIENVMQADFKRPTFTLCGSMFKKNLKRHRKFYCNFFVLCPAHYPHTKHGEKGVARIYGNGSLKDDNKKQWAEALGVKDIDNVTKKGLSQGIPTYYVDWIMKQFKIWWSKS